MILTLYRSLSATELLDMLNNRTAGGDKQNVNCGKPQDMKDFSSIYNRRCVKYMSSKSIVEPLKMDSNIIEVEIDEKYVFKTSDNKLESSYFVYSCAPINYINIQNI